MGKKRTYYKKQQIPFFISKLRSILQNSSNKQIISWHDSGNTFVINDQNLLINQILPQHFKHNNMASFVRQLNLYGFRKLQNVMQYCHQNFKENQPQKSKLIKRIVKIKNKKQNKMLKNRQIQKSIVHNSEELESLIQENKKLKQEQRVLLRNKKQGEKALRDLKIYVKNMKDQVQQVQKQKDQLLKQSKKVSGTTNYSTLSTINKNRFNLIQNTKGKHPRKSKKNLISNEMNNMQQIQKGVENNQQVSIQNQYEQINYESYSQDSMEDLNSPNSDEYIDSVMNSYFS